MFYDKDVEEIHDESDSSLSYGEVQPIEFIHGYEPIIPHYKTKEQLILICTMIVTVLFLISGIFKFSFSYIKSDRGDRPLYISLSMDSESEKLIGEGLDDFSEETDKWAKNITYVDVAVSAISVILLLSALFQLIRGNYPKVFHAIGSSALVLPIAHISNFIFFLHMHSEYKELSIITFSIIPFVMIAIDVLVVFMNYRVSNEILNFSENTHDKIVGFIPFFMAVNTLFLALGVICFSYMYQKQNSDYMVSTDMLNNYFIAYYAGIDEFFDAIEDDWQKLIYIIDFSVAVIAVLLASVSAVLSIMKKKIDALRISVIAAIITGVGYISNVIFYSRIIDDIKSRLMEYDLQKDYVSEHYKLSPVPFIMIAVCIASVIAARYVIRPFNKQEEITD